MLTNDNHQSITQRYIEIKGQQIPVTEEIYRAYKRPAWAEHKRNEREQRCRDVQGNRCTKSCFTCDLERAEKGLQPLERNGSSLSLDRLNEESGFEAEDTLDLTELVVNKLYLEVLYEALEELDPDNRRIIELFKMGLSEREIALNVGLSQKAINKRKTKLFAQLQERLKDFM
jgi:RNA polymerase sigma factor (sigma-70 family)